MPRRRDQGWRSLRSRPTPAAAAPPPPPSTDGAAPPNDGAAPPTQPPPRQAPPGRGGRFGRARAAATGTRGGAARASVTAGAAPASASTPPPAADGGSVFDTLFRGSPLKGVDWTISLFGFLVYIYVVTTFVLPIGDVAMIVALLGLFFIVDRITLPAMLIWMAALVIWSAASYTATDYPGLVGKSVMDFGKLWLIVLVAVTVLNTRANVRLFTILFLGGFALYPTRGAIFNYLGGYTLFGRAIWNYTYKNPNDLAALALLQLSMAYGLYRVEREKWIRWCAMAGIVVMPLLILMTQSRGAFIALACFILFILGAQRRRVRAFVTVAAIGAVLAMVAPRGVWERVGGLKNATNTQQLEKVDPEGSARQRWEIWRVAARIIEDHPLIGIGRGAYPLVHAEYALTRPGLARTARGKRDTHSTYLNLAAELGYPGLLLFLGLVGTTLIWAERVRRRARRLMPETAMQLYALEMGMVGMLIAGIWGSFASISFLYIHLALVTAVARLTAQELRAIESGAALPQAALAGGGGRAARPTAAARRRLAPGGGAARPAGGGDGAQPAY